MFYTLDGGQAFAEILLPVIDGDEDMAGNAWGYTSKDMDYIFTPTLEDDSCLYVAVSYDSTWQYLEYHENL